MREDQRRFLGLSLFSQATNIYSNGESLKIMFLSLFQLRREEEKRGWYNGTGWRGAVIF